MTALYIILGILLFFILLLSVKLRVTVHSEDGVSLSVRWLFIKINILPKDESKKKKKKKKKKEKPEEKEEEKKDEKVKEPKDNMFVNFYHNNGVEGVIDLLKRLGTQLKGTFKRIAKSFIIEELYISMLVGGGDAEQTAEKYGKTCAAFYPAMGLIVDTVKVKKYKFDISPDFIAGSSNARLHAQISVIPRKLINGLIASGAGLVTKVVIKFLKGSKANKGGDTGENNSK